MLYNYTPPPSKPTKKPKYHKITASGPDVLKRELSEKAHRRKFSFELLPKANDWVQVKVTDARAKSAIVEIYDTLGTERACNCDEYFTEQGSACIHLAALEGLEKLGWAQDKQAATWTMALGRERTKIPFLKSSPRAGCIYWDSANQTSKVLGKSPQFSENWIAYCKYQKTLQPKSSITGPLPSSAGLLNGNLALYPYQEDIFQKMILAKRGICSMVMGAGKSSPVTSNVLTPDGWKKMGDVKVGDYVIGSSGQPTKVVGVFPQGLKKTYKVTFTDDSSMECCDEHLWAIRTPQQKLRKNDFQVKELRHFMNDLVDKQGNHKYHIPMVKPVEFSKRETKLDPYFLGLLLGDGGMSQNSVYISSSDDFIVTEASKRLPKNVVMKQKSTYDWVFVKTSSEETKENKLKSLLVDLKLMGKKSPEKFIPSEYKYNDFATRLEVLQGLMDSDGFCDKQGKNTIFYSTSKQLVLDVQELVQSFGGTAVIKDKQTYYVYKGEKKTGLPSFAVHISLPTDIIPFKLPRKLQRFVPKTKYQPNRYFKSVEYVGNIESQCISVEADDHLYVAENYIVTHNTLTTIACYAHLKKQNPNLKMFVIAPKSLCLQWLSEITRATGDKGLFVKTPEDIKKISKGGVFVATYQFVTRHIEEFKKHNYDCVVIDEIQFVKNNDTKTWKAISKINSVNFYGLSGTVIENRLDDFYSIMEIVAKGSLGPKWRFCHQFQDVMVVTPSRVIYTGVRNLEQLKELAKDHVWFYDKLILPPISHLRITTKCEKKEQDVHDEYREKAKLLIAKSMQQPLSQVEKMLLQSFLLKARQAANAAELISKVQEPQSNKVKELLKIVSQHVGVNEKLVIFSEWTEYLAICKRETDALGIKSVVYTGEENLKQRQKAVSDFQNDPQTMIFFASEAAGAGLDGLQLASHTVIHMELPWNPSKLDQRTGRVYRMLQTKPVTVYYMIAEDTIESSIEKLLDSKRDIRKQTLGSFV